MHVYDRVTRRRPDMVPDVVLRLLVHEQPEREILKTGEIGCPGLKLELVP